VRDRRAVIVECDAGLMHEVGVSRAPNVLPRFDAKAPCGPFHEIELLELLQHGTCGMLPA
jgi:hypothetical protein